ncbi:MAG TPA: DUF5616 domain-containing protein, partial [Opitutus sp.]|nr:DUF5616 domain-containing protein [Opitutus sp.]
QLIGITTEKWNIAKCRWLLDRPVGNSGRLKSTLEAVAQEFNWHWEVVLEFSPDRRLAATLNVVASSDSGVLDRCERWCNLAREVVTVHAQQAFLLDLESDE